DPDGAPIVNATVSFNSTFVSGGGFTGTIFGATTTTSAAGAFRFVVFPGTFSLQATPPTGSPLGATVVSATVSDDTSITITLPEPVVYGGVVTDQDGNAIANQRVTLVQGSLFVSDITDADGAFAIQVAPGTYTVRVDNAQFSPPPTAVPSSYSL